MKIIRFISVVLLMVLLSVNFSACSSEDKDSNNEDSYYKEVYIDGIYYNIDSQKRVAEVTRNYLNSGKNYYGDIIIPSSIKFNDKNYSVISIGHNAFGDELGVLSITIPSSVQVIEHGAFTYCENLVAVTFPDGIRNIDDHSFSHCSSLTSITLPESLTSISYGCFEYCLSLKSLTIPNNVKSIGPEAFVHCENLTKLIIGENVVTIESAAFNNCKKLTAISFPKSVSSIGDNSFRWCTSLTKLEIGENVDSISYAAFTQCPKLEVVYCYAKNPPQTDETAFDKNIENVKLYVPSGALNEYKSISPWNRFGEIVTLTNH